jgi:antitoxin component YwqK of YwqJK toxin-antitoxin module
MRIIMIIVGVLLGLTLMGQVSSDSVKIEYFKLSKNRKVKKVYFYDSLAKLHPKVSLYRRNGTLKIDYFYNHGEYLYSLRYSKKGDVVKERGLKIDYTKSPFMYSVDSTQVKYVGVNRFDSLGRKTGLWYEFQFAKDLNGLSYTNVYQTGLYKDGLKEGVWKFYHRYGKQLYQTITYKADVINGKVVFYNRSGIVTSRYQYMYGIKNGTYRAYYHTGELREKATFLNGRLSGEYFEYKKKWQGEKAY